MLRILSTAALLVCLLVGAATAQSTKLVSEVTVVVASALAEDPAALDPDKPLMGPEIGANELDFVEIVMSLEDRYAMVLEDEEIGGRSKTLTIRDLARMVDERLNH